MSRSQTPSKILGLTEPPVPSTTSSIASTLSGQSLQGREAVIVLNVGGTRFHTLPSTLAAYPETLLGTMFSQANRELLVAPGPNGEYFFDRNPRPFSIILDFYRSGSMDLFRPFDLGDGRRGCVGIAEIRAELDYFQIPDSSWSGSVMRSLHADAAARISSFVDTLLEIVSVHLESFIDIVVIHFSRGEDRDSAVLRNVNHRMEERCEELLERCQYGFRLLSDEKLQATVADTMERKFPVLRFTVQMIRHELLVLCLGGYLDVDEVRKHLSFDPSPSGKDE